jgi:hypothetical protein
MKKIVLVCFLVIFQAACAAVRGRTVNQLSADPASISFSYGHWYTGERTFTMRTAETHCGQFNKQAEVANEVVLGTDRTSVTYSCIDP